MADEVILTLDGTAMPKPKKEGVTITVEKIWDEDTRRASSGLMQGTIVAKKHTYKIDFPPLTGEQIMTLESVVSNTSKPFFSIALYVGTRSYYGTVYAGNTTHTVHSLKLSSKKYYTGYSVTLIER